MNQHLLTTVLLLFPLHAVIGVHAKQVTVEFEELPLAPESFYNGSDFNGDFSSQETTFNNLFTDFGGGCCWSGWAYSNTTNTTSPDVSNQYSAVAGSGANGSLKYGVAFDGLGGGGGIQPLITLPTDFEPVSIQVTNTTFAALSMAQGDAFAKKFGGPTGNDPDWFRLHVDGRNDNGVLVDSTEEISIILADFRFSDNSQDFILNDWAELNLTPLQNLGVTTLAFRFSSSDVGNFGINTPLYVAIDDLVLESTCSEQHASDFNADCRVDQSDLLVWQTGYGRFQEINAQLSDGDTDQDGDVDAPISLLGSEELLPPI